MKIRIETVTLPAFLAPALINGDVSGIEDSPEDMALLDKALAYVAPGHIVSCGEESFFTRYTDLGPGLVCDALTYTVLYHESEAL